MAQNDQFELLTVEQRSAIVGQWLRPFGLFAEWDKARYDGIQYATEMFVDIIRLLMQQQALGYIYEDVPFGVVQVLNNWADKVESVPDIVVTVGNYTHGVAELNTGGRTDEQINRYIPERYEMEMQFMVEGRNKMECDRLTAKFGTLLMQLILPTLAQNDPAINAMRKIRVSQSTEKRRSSNFVTHYKTITFPATLDYIPISAKDKNQKFMGLDDGATTTL